AVLRGLVPEREAREGRERLAGALATDRTLGLRVHRDGVRREHRHPYRGRRDGQIGQLEDLAHLVDELDLLAGVAVVRELVDVGDQVEGDLVLEEARGDGLPAGPRE